MKTESYLTTFPSDANFRLGIRGLAFCKLSTKASTIHFMRHLKDHNLRLSVYRRRDYKDKPQIFSGIENQPIGISENIKITTKAPSPPDIFADISNNDEKLSKLVNLPYYHKSNLKQKPLPAGINPPTILSTDNLRFYTLELVTKDHCLWDGNVMVIDNKKIGYSLGGKVKVEDNSVTLLQIGENEPIKLPQNENGQWLYDILLENDCDKTPSKCPKPDPDNLDFKHFYDLLEDMTSPAKKLRLEVSPLLKKHLRTGACNVAILEPEMSPD